MKSTISFSVVFFILQVFCCGARAELIGGCGKVNITPPLGIPLIGSYGKPSDDIIDELYAKALVLNDGNNTIAIVSTDLLYTPLEEITSPVRKIVKEIIGIEEKNVLVCAIHTHSGPEVFSKSKLRPDKRIERSTIDQFYLDTLVKKIASSVLIAHKNMQDDSGGAGARVKIGAAVGQIPEIVYNRRPRTGNGRVKMAFTLPPEVRATRKIETGAEGNIEVTFTAADGDVELDFGPVDPQVGVLRVEDTDGGIVCSLVNFGCHPVCIYPSMSTSISADYPACATGVVEQVEGGLCLFALGLAGNAVPYDRGLSQRRQIGRALGGEVLRRLQFITTTGDVTVSGLKKKVEFPVKRPAPETAGVGEKKPEPVISEIQVLRLGDIYILGLPGEVLVEVGLKIRKRAGLENLFIVTLSNDAIGYVCHSGAYEEGGYEPDSGTNLARGAGEIMAEQAVALLDQIRTER